ncbi:MAG: hypothetical protein NUW09_03425 [Deltaproteobacteria bacterium]|nr:hypothetical protein [Deltaproteobacteria bacterium]
MGNEKPRFRRRTYLVKPGLQLRLSLQIFIYLAVYSIVLGFFIFYPLYIEMYSATGLVEQERLAQVVLYLHKRLWIGLFAVAFLTGVHAAFTAHRVAGPAYRFEKMLDAMIQGDYSQRVTIRTRDELKDIETLLNRLAAALERGIAEDALRRSSIVERLGRAKDSLSASPSDIEGAKRLIEDMSRELGTKITI